MPRPTIKLLPLEQNPVTNGEEIPMPTVKIKKVGSVVALNLRYQIRNTGSLTPEMEDPAEAPFLSPNEPPLDTKFPKASRSDPSDFVAVFESPGGRRYRYRAVIAGRRNIENERFEVIK
jgi:hypothetical protein